LTYHEVGDLLSFFWNRVLSEFEEGWRIVGIFNVDNDGNRADETVRVGGVRVESSDFEDVFLFRLVVEFA
jgi:hypothetical protein